MNKTKGTRPSGKSAKSTAMPITLSAGKSEDRVLAETVVAGMAGNAYTTVRFGEDAFGDLSLAESILSIKETARAVNDGDMRPVEDMLYSQAVALQAIFTKLSLKANAQEYLKQFQVNLTLALRAQAQCRATLEALAEIKNPRPVSFVKQANIANGPQQVNNGADRENRTDRAGAQAHAEEDSRQQNELLGPPDGNHLDFGTQGAAGRADTHLEAMEAGDRTALT